MINLIRTRNFKNRASCRFELSISIISFRILAVKNVLLTQKKYEIHNTREKEIAI